MKAIKNTISTRTKEQRGRISKNHYCVSNIGKAVGLRNQLIADNTDTAVYYFTVD